MPRPRAARLHVVPKPSVPAKPSVVFANENWFDVAADIKPLFKRHWEELGRDRERIPLDPNWPQFAAMAGAGILHTLTARLNGELVGYVITLVTPHLHYKSTLHAIADMYWLAPEHRKGWTGIRMVRAWEAEMRKAKVVRIEIAENLLFKNRNGLKMRSLFSALGFRATDVHFRKVLS